MSQNINQRKWVSRDPKVFSIVGLIYIERKLLSDACAVRNMPMTQLIFCLLNRAQTAVERTDRRRF